MTAIEASRVGDVAGVGADAVVRWPAERFYFAVLDARALPKRARRDARKLGFLFEAALPLPIEEISAVYRELGGGRVLACGIEGERIRQEVSPETLALLPDRVPEFADEDIDPESLNVLIGAFEPSAITKIRRRTTAWIAVGLLAAAAVVVAGFERRIAAATERAEAIAGQEIAMLDSALGRASPGVPSAQRRAALTAERRRLERTRSSSGASSAIDVPDLLARTLAAWPGSNDLEVDALLVNESGVSVRGTAAAASSAQALTDALARVGGLEVESPQFTSAGESKVQVQVVAKIAKPSPAAAGANR